MYLSEQSPEKSKQHDEPDDEHKDHQTLFMLFVRLQRIITSPKKQLNKMVLGSILPQYM